MYRKNKNLSSILQRKIELWGNRKSSEPNRLGQYEIVPQQIKSIWAAVIPQTGSLLQGRAADTTLARTTHKVIIRYDKNVSEDMWFVIDNNRYDILYILNPYLNNERLEVFTEVLL